MDYLTFFVETIMEDFMDHLKRYKTACSKVYSNEVEGLNSKGKIRMIDDAYFEDEDSENPWKEVCCSEQHRLG